MDLRINMEKTGARIRQLVMDSGYTMQEIMQITGVTAVQTIYKWYYGKSIPALETQLVLCRLFQIQITDLLVIEDSSTCNQDMDVRQDSLWEYRSASSGHLARYLSLLSDAA